MRCNYLLLLIVLGYACQSNSNGNFKFTKELLESKTLKFPLDKSTSNTSFNVEAFRDPTTNKRLLVYLNLHKPSIIYFDLEKTEVFKEIGRASCRERV